jgi:hypothetical protein
MTTGADSRILPVDSPSIEPRVRRLLAEPVGFHNPPSLSAIRAKAGAIERRRNSHEGLTKPWLCLSLCSVGPLLTLNSVSIIQI